MRRRGDGIEQPALQVVSADGEGGVREAAPDQPPPRRWALVVVVLGVVGSAVLATSGSLGGAGGSASTTVPAALLSDLEPVTVDVISSESGVGLDGWQLAEVDSSVRLGDVVAVDDGFVAVGSDSDGLGLWRSTTGEVWEPLVRLEDPADVELLEGPSRRWSVFQFDLLEWQGSAVVIGRVDDGVAVWVDGDFEGVIDELGNGQYSGMVAGDQLLAVVESPASAGGGESSQELVRYDWLVSDNGVDWTRVSPTGLPDGYTRLIGHAAGFFYAMTEVDAPEGSSLHLYRSSDGITWVKVDVEAPETSDSRFAQIHDMVEVDDGLLAVGMFVDSGAGIPDPAMWQSSDGARWTPVPLGGDFRSSAVTLELVAVNPSHEGTAIVSVDGVRHELPKDSVIHTDAGTVAITTINSDSIRLSSDSIQRQGSTLLRSGTPLTLDVTPLLLGIIADGQRVAVVGALVTSNGSPVPAVWLSEDAGITWQVSVFNDSETSGFVRAAIHQQAIALIGNSEAGATAAWHNQPDSDSNNDSDGQ